MGTISYLHFLLAFYSTSKYFNRKQDLKAGLSRSFHDTLSVLVA